jgi:hypothetical protein
VLIGALVLADDRRRAGRAGALPTRRAAEHLDSWIRHRGRRWGPHRNAHDLALTRDWDGVVIGASFTLPPGVTQRGDADNPAFSFDRAGSVPVTATSSHYRDDVGTDCTATVRRDLGWPARCCE